VQSYNLRPPRFPNGNQMLSNCRMIARILFVKNSSRSKNMWWWQRVKWIKIWTKLKHYVTVAVYHLERNNYSWNFSEEFPWRRNKETLSLVKANAVKTKRMGTAVNDTKLYMEYEFWLVTAKLINGTTLTKVVFLSPGNFPVGCTQRKSHIHLRIETEIYWKCCKWWFPWFNFLNLI